MQQLAPNVYVETASEATNVAAILTSQGLVYVDAPMIPDQARAWKGVSAALTGDPPLYLINTDYHGGHSIGDPILGGTVVAHEAVWQHIVGMSESARKRVLDRWEKEHPFEFPEIKKLAFTRPELTFNGRMVLYCGDTVIQLIYTGGHTPATAMVYLPDSRVLFTGDILVLGRYPYLGEANTKEWLDALTLIRRMDPAIVVPGHGELCDAKATEPLSEYIRAIRGAVRRYFKDGRSKSETVNKLRRQDWLTYPGVERTPALDSTIKANISRVYDEFKFEARRQ
jgi:cyclase